MNDQDESTELWAEVIAAVEYLRECVRPGLTVWEVLDEATVQWTSPGDRSRPEPFADPDPLRTSIENLFIHVGPAGGYGTETISKVLTSVLIEWLERTRCDHNDGMVFGDRRFRTGLQFERVNDST